MEQTKSSMKIAGVDVGKQRLDAAIHGGSVHGGSVHGGSVHGGSVESPDEMAVDNAPAGIAALIAWLKAREVGRVGLEATGAATRRPSAWRSRRTASRSSCISRSRCGCSPS